MIQIVCARCKKPAEYTEHPVWPGTPSDTMTYSVVPCCTAQKHLVSLNSVNDELEILITNVEEDMEQIFESFKDYGVEAVPYEQLKNLNESMKGSIRSAMDGMSVAINND